MLGLITVYILSYFIRNHKYQKYLQFHQITLQIFTIMDSKLMLYIDSIYQAYSCIIVMHHNIQCRWYIWGCHVWLILGLVFEEFITIMTLNHANNEKFSLHYFFSVWNLILIRFVITFLFRESCIKHYKKIMFK